MLHAPFNFAIKSLLIGALISALIAGWFWFSIAAFLDSALLVPGSVIAVYPVDAFEGNSYDMDFSFQTQAGQEITLTVPTGSDPPPYSNGDRLEVYYNPLNPTDAKISSTYHLYFFPLIFTIAAGIAFVTAILLMIMSKKRKQYKEWLLANGQVVHADVIAIHPVISLKTHTATSFTISCQWLNPATQEKLLFESEILDHDPTAYLKDKKLSVYIDPKAPTEKYWIDTTDV